MSSRVIKGAKLGSVEVSTLLPRTMIWDGRNMTSSSKVKNSAIKGALEANGGRTINSIGIKMRIRNSKFYSNNFE